MTNDRAAEASVVIRRPPEEVFRFYRDFRNMPRFLGDVMAVELVGPADSRWTIQGPLGMRLAWTIRVTEERANKLIRYETVKPPPLKGFWVIHFAQGPNAGETQVREAIKAPFGGLGRAALALVGKNPEKEVAANLNRLRELMETGRVTDTSYAVRGKFDQPVD